MCQIRTKSSKQLQRASHTIEKQSPNTCKIDLEIINCQPLKAECSNELSLTNDTNSQIINLISKAQWHLICRVTRILEWSVVFQGRIKPRHRSTPRQRRDIVIMRVLSPVIMTLAPLTPTYPLNRLRPIRVTVRIHRTSSKHVYSKLQIWTAYNLITDH